MRSPTAHEAMTVWRQPRANWRAQATGTTIMDETMRAPTVRDRKRRHEDEYCIDKPHIDARDACRSLVEGDKEELFPQ